MTQLYNVHINGTKVYVTQYSYIMYTLMVLKSMSMAQLYNVHINGTKVYVTWHSYIMYTLMVLKSMSHDTVI